MSHASRLKLLSLMTALLFPGYAAASMMGMTAEADDPVIFPPVVVIGARIHCPAGTTMSWSGDTFTGCVGGPGNTGGNQGGGSTVPSGGSSGGSGGSVATRDPDPNKEKCGNPILPATGNKIEPETDFVTAGEMGLLLSRTYNHYWQGKGFFGPNWTSSLDYKLQNGLQQFGSPCTGTSATCPLGSTRTIEAWRPDGRKIIFNRDLNDATLYNEAKAQAIQKIRINTDGSATLYSESYNVESYANDGKILKVVNEQGIGWTYAYSSGLPVKITHASGRYISLVWTSGLVTRVTDPAGNIYNYGYTNGRLSSVANPGASGAVITYQYELTSDPSALTGKTFDGIRYSTFAYSNGYAISSEHNSLNKFTFAYTQNTDGTLSVVETNPLGLKTTVVYKDGKPLTVTGSPSTYCPATFTSTEYDTNGYVSSATDANGNKTTYIYNAKGQLLEMVEGYGTSVARKTTWVWDDTINRVISVTVGGAVAGTEVYRLSYTYTPDNRIATQTKFDLTGTGASHTTTYAYTKYASGILSKIVVDGPLPGAGDAITYSYSSVGDLISVQDSLAHGTTFQNYNGLGEPARVVGLNGAITDITYDGQGREINRRTYRNGVTQDYAKTYDHFGNVSQTTMPDGQVRQNYYGLNHDWLSAIEEPMQPVPLGDAWQGIDLDRNAAGNITAKSTYVLRPSLSGSPCLLPTPCLQQRRATSPLDTQATVTGVRRAESLSTTSTSYVQDFKTKSFVDYDELSRPIAKRGNNGQKVTYHYDLNGNITSIVDSTGGTTTLTYDSLDRIIRSQNAKNAVTLYAYDTTDHLIKVTDPRGRATVYQYDGLGQELSVTSPDTGKSSFSYDAYGRRVSMTRATGAVTTYGYDTLGRLTSAVAGGQTHTFTFDACTNGKGLLCKVSDPTGSVSYTYTPEGLVATQVSAMPASGAGTLAYAYDGMGRLSKITYPASLIAQYGYSYGKLTSLTATVGGVTTNIVSAARYLPFGPATGWTYGNGLARSYSYDLDGRLTGVGTSSATNALQSLTFAYNTNDLLTKITNGANANGTQTYGYDALSQITSIAATGLAENFAYDASGNRISRTKNGVVTNYGIAAANNRLMSLTGGENTSFAYDADGNVVSGDSATYSYDPFNRLATSTKGAYATTYATNALGQRVYKKVNSYNHYFLYAPDNAVLSQYTTGVSWTHFLRFNGETVAMLRSGHFSYIHGDSLGRPEIATDANQLVTWRGVNYAFDRSVTIDTIGGLNLGFPGQWYDGEIGNWSNGFRDLFDGGNGRYLQSDPVGLAAGVNTYAYANSLPTMNVDPFGQQSQPDWLKDYTMSPAQYAVKCELDRQREDQLEKNKALTNCLAKQVGQDVAEDLTEGLTISAAGEYFGPEVGLPAALLAAAIESRPIYKAVKAGLTAHDVLSCVEDAYGL